MKRDFLKELGIEDKETINKILDENSADIGRAKGEVDDLKSQLSQLQSQLDKKTTEFDSLKDSTKDYNDLSAKIKELDASNAQLIADKKQLEANIETRVAELQKSHAIETGVRDAKAKNVKAVMALLDMEKITYENGALNGLTEQLTTLQSGEDTSFLFGGVSVPIPAGTQINNPPHNPGGSGASAKTFVDAIANALSKNN